MSQSSEKSGRRDDVLVLLKSAESALTIAQIAEQLDVHSNTVRFHLQTLVTQGLAERAERGIAGPGRPPLRFRAIRQMDPGGPRRYRVLAEVLTAAVSAGHDPAGTAYAAGSAWGRGLVGSAQQDPVTALVDLLDELGFAPRPTADSIELRRCPFVELARTNSEVVCSIHHGLMQGVLEGHHAPITVERLDPFVEPDLCLAHLAESGVPR